MTKFLFIFIALSFSLESMSQPPNPESMALAMLNDTCIGNTLDQGKLQVLVIAPTGVGCVPSEDRPDPATCQQLQDGLNRATIHSTLDEAGRLTANYINLCQ